jgi:glycosyltransferase involved in cell wall biosynthesis
MTRKKPAISIIMPVYNTPPVYLQEAIDSILQQTFLDYELIIIDDGSSNAATLSVIEQLKHPNVHKLRHAKNRGLSEARNTAIASARGKYIATMDSDDVASPERFQRQFDFMEAHPDIVLSGIKIKEFQGRDRVMWTPTSDSAIRAHMLFRNPIAGCAVIFRHAVVVKHGLRYRTMRIGEDYTFLYECSKVGKVCNLSELLLLYRVHHLSLMGNAWVAQENFMERFMPMYKFILEDFLGEVVKPEWLRAHILICVAPYFPKVQDIKEINGWARHLLRHPKVSVRQKSFLLFLLALMIPRAIKRRFFK